VYARADDTRHYDEKDIKAKTFDKGPRSKALLSHLDDDLAFRTSILDVGNSLFG